MDAPTLFQNSGGGATGSSGVAAMDLSESITELSLAVCDRGAHTYAVPAGTPGES